MEVLSLERFKQAPKSSDKIRLFFPPIRNRLPRESSIRVDCSAAFSCLTLIEYFERLAYGTTFERSKAFIHACVSDGGSEIPAGLTRIQATLRAIVRRGVPLEILWP